MLIRLFHVIFRRGPSLSGICEKYVFSSFPVAFLIEIILINEIMLFNIRFTLRFIPFESPFNLQPFFNIFITLSNLSAATNLDIHSCQHYAFLGPISPFPGHKKAL